MISRSVSSHLRARNNIQGIIYSVWLDPSVTDVDDLDHNALCAVHRKATAKAIKKAMRTEPAIEWLLENHDQVKHYFHELVKEGKL
jgi:5,6,7,8-tetrahydromethanopterin hydro-lyase